MVLHDCEKKLLNCEMVYSKAAQFTVTCTIYDEEFATVVQANNLVHKPRGYDIAYVLHFVTKSMTKKNLCI